ncbi:MAG: hypothetical protein EXR93_10110 [Gemmatimonadetes bacterium]|nr:hypothetical protein [Gemmatimonadota bacterium]
MARHQLVIEGVATETKNPVLKDLAGRLHRHHLGAITFSRGVEGSEILDFLARVSIEADHSEKPLGLALSTDARSASWPHIRLYPLMYDRLQLLADTNAPQGEEDQETRTQRTRAAQLWIGMARAALASEGSGLPGAAVDELTKNVEAMQTAAEKDEHDDVATDPAAVASAIENHPRGTAYDQVIVGYMLQIAEELRSAGGQEAIALRNRMSKLVGTLSDSTLHRLMDMGGDGIQRRKFLLDASQGMAMDAVIDLVRAAGDTKEQTVSHSFLRMLQKLARHADASTGARQEAAEQGVLDQVAELIRGWSLSDPNPDAYRLALEALSTTNPLFAVAPEARFAPEPRRIMEMALEVGATGDALTRAVDELITKGQIKWLVKTLDEAVRGDVTESVWTQTATPDRLSGVLKEEPLDAELVDALVPRMGRGAIDPLLDTLSEMESETTRRALMDRVVKLGPDVGVAAVARLVDERWYVKRNMLKIIGDLKLAPPGFSPVEYFQHAEPRVRREALRLMLRDPALRERAILLALGDPDERTVRTALAAAQQGCPPTAIPLIASCAVSGATLDLRQTSIRVLGSSGQRAALDTLLVLTAPRRNFFGFKRTPPKRPEYLTALSALRQFGDDARARAILDHAAASKDPEIAQAAVGKRASVLMTAPVDL